MSVLIVSGYGFYTYLVVFMTECEIISKVSKNKVLSRVKAVNSNGLFSQLKYMLGFPASNV